MNKSNNMTKTIAIAFILMMTFAVAAVAIPTTKGALELQIAAFLSVAPNPVGVGQQITISGWTQPLPPTANDRFNNLSVTMTKPDGTKQTFGPVVGGPLGNWFWTYVPDTVGTYLFQYHVPDQPFPNSAGGNILYKGADGQVVNLTVQQDPVAQTPQVPPPTQYWTFPINAQNQLWAANVGSWLRGSYDGVGSNGFNPYTSPTSAHITWRWQNAFGGLEGGPFGAVAYSQGKQYEGKMTPGIVISNFFYQYGPIGDRVNSPLNQLTCINIETGQVVWKQTINSSGVSVGSVPLQGQLYEFDSSNQVGIHAYLWYMGSTTWSMYDAFNGNWIMDFKNVTSTTGDDTVIVMETKEGNMNGNMLQYRLNTNKGWLACWNFTKACVGTSISNGVITWQSQQEKDQFGVAGGQWRPASTAMNDWMRGIEWNVTVPIENQYMGPGKTAAFSWGGVSKAGGIGVAESWWNDPVLVPKNIIELYGYSLDPTHPGKLWGPVNLTTTANTARAIDDASGTYVLNRKETMTYIGYDLQTGQQKWETPPMTYPWGAYGSQSMTTAYGKMYAGSYDGLHCYDLTTGKELWFFYAGDSGLDTPYGTWLGNGGMVGGGICYYRTGEFHPTSVMLRGDKMYAINATTGQNIWNMTFWADGALLAQGKLIANNIYDNYIYCFGKGQSATTVSAPQTAVPTGTNLLIQGTITDQSPGLTKDTGCIAEQYMGPWMDYMYMQQPKPASATGVPVSIDAYDPNGNFIHLGDTTSDTSGVYTLAVDSSTLSAGAGQYRIIATFKGTDSYWQSSAETGLIVQAAATPAPTGTGTGVTAADVNNTVMTYTAILGVLIIIAIVIGVVLLLRKRA